MKEFNINKIDNIVSTIIDANPQVILIGEASHGTKEYYEIRNEITKRLISLDDIGFVGIEGDWASTYEANKFATGGVYDMEASEVLFNSFQRWPTWMWANEQTVDFISWLHRYNMNKIIPHEMTYFLGLDVYGLYESLEAMAEYLSENHPEHIGHLKEAIECYNAYGSLENYSQVTPLVPDDCSKEVIKLLMNVLNLKEKEFKSYKNKLEWFNAAQNALVVKNGDHYYQNMLRGGKYSWNIRDNHMMETIENIRTELVDGRKAIVWAHNTHIGDARATDMKRTDTINLGQLVREKYGIDNTYAVGFGSYTGSVIASNKWDGEIKTMFVPQAKEHSWEHYFHNLNKEAVYVNLRENREDYNKILGHRAIGVVYHPEFEQGNYVPTNLANRYDMFIYFDVTTPLNPIYPPVDKRGIPETYPVGV